MPEPLNGFDWNDSEAVIIKQVDAIAVYYNNDGDIVIRQQHPMNDEDGAIIIPSDRLDEVIGALQNLGGDDGDA